MTIGRVAGPWPDLPPRSRLYSLAPCDVGTLWRESLTGYLNRLAGTHRVSPRALVAQEILPALDTAQPCGAARQLAEFGSHGAMSLNGVGSAGQAWATILEHLTARPEVHQLTARWWIGDLSSRRLLRVAPAWCPDCLSEWRAADRPIVQPLLWMLHLVTICPRHRRPLTERCCQCHHRQAVLATHKARPGECTRCAQWLGRAADRQQASEPRDDVLAWQAWVIAALEELLAASLARGVLPWAPFFANLAAFLEEEGAHTKLAHVTGVNRQLLYCWVGQNYAYTPTLGAIFKFCYVCEVTPLQLMTNHLDPLRYAIRQDVLPRSPQPRQPRRRVDTERCREAIQAVLAGHEDVLGVEHLARDLGYTGPQLVYYFPDECALITARADAYRARRKQQRISQVCTAVRQAVMKLHAEGRFPSHNRLQHALPMRVMRMPDASAAWHAALRELGLEA